MKDANINPLRTPSKTNMYMRSYYLGVKEGFGAKTKDLYYDEDETDFEEAKKRYREIKNIQITKK